MDEKNKTIKEWMTPGTHRFGILCAALGIVLATLLLCIGLWKTIVVAAFAVGGYSLGAVEGKTERVKALINKLFPPKGE